MDNIDIEYQSPIESLRRLTQQDNSDKFILHIKFAKKDKKEIEIQTTINKIRVISKKVNQMYQIDPTIREYELNIPINIESDDTQKQVELLLKSAEEKVKISKNQQNSFKIIQILLGEPEENNIDIQINNIDEAFSFLSTELHTKSIEYLSHNLLEIITKNYFTNIEISIAKEIIDFYFEIEKTNKSDELTSIFTNLLQNDDENIVMHFLLHIDDSEYTKEMVDYILDHMSDEVVNSEFCQIIGKYRNLLLKMFSQEKHDKRHDKQNLIDCSFKGDELDGIFSRMQKTFNSDLCESGNLKISGGGDQDDSNYPQYSLKNLIKYDSQNIDKCFYNFHLKIPSESDGWIEFDFGERKINLSSYTLRSCCSGAGSEIFPKSWRIVGSNDGEKWDELDHQVNNSSLRIKLQQHRFECQNKNSNYYKLIRYIQEDSTNSNYKYYIFFTCIEFFGSILLQSK